MKITLNNKQIEVEENLTILDVAKKENINIPVLCHLNLHNAEMINDGARCRVCMVELEGKHTLVAACNTKVSAGMNIKTNTKRCIDARKVNLELLLSDHPENDCLNCLKNKNCELQQLKEELQIDEINYKGEQAQRPHDTSSLAFTRDLKKCILCNRCATMCNNVQTVGVYSNVNRGFNTLMTTAFNHDIISTPCTYCGQCVSVCPTGALIGVDNTKEVIEAINSPDKFVIVQTAPAIRVTLDELFGMPTGTNVTGKMVTALKLLGFDKVYDTNFAADLTVVEETKEFIDRLEEGSKLPVLTSCCPSWINFIEYHYPELLAVPSTCKSPQQMFGSIAKSYLAKKLAINPENIIVVSIMPCITKKYEATKDQILVDKKIKETDFVLTTRELAHLIKEKGLDFTNLEDSTFDPIMGESTGASGIFGASGGVIEAVIRNTAYVLENKKIAKIDFEELRDIKGIKEATVTINNQKINVAIAHGLGNARYILEKIKSGTSNYHAIEIMACPGGCIGGGGQPYHLYVNENILAKRRFALYEIDKTKEKRISAENEEIKKLYEEFLGKIGGELAHELLHTSYKSKKN